MSEEDPLPNDFKDFVKSLYLTVSSDSHSFEAQSNQINQVYEQKQKEICEKYKDRNWPSAEAIARVVGDDPIFRCLYTERSFAHLFTRNKSPNMEPRVGAWQNYVELFELLIRDEDGSGLRSQGGPDIRISGVWAFDIMHEFVYQFQSCCQFRTGSNKNELDLKIMEGNPDVWAADKVYYYLHQLIRVSKVREKLAAKRGDAVPVSYPSQLHYMLGFFAMVSLNRLECLLGDYASALKVVAPLGQLDREEDPLLSINLYCQVSLYYHIGFSYMMMRRYKDAIRTFREICSYARTSQHHQAQGPNKNADLQTQVNKLTEKMIFLQQFCDHLCGDQQLEKQLQRNPDDKQGRLAAFTSGNVEALVSQFSNKHAPKFVTPALPSYIDLKHRTGERTHYGYQIGIFRQEVEEMAALPKLRDYLKLYSTTDVAKLARYTDQEPDVVRRQLIMYKQKLQQTEQGRLSSALDLHYYLDEDTVYVEEPERERNEVSHYFLREIERLDEVSRELRRSAQAASSNYYNYY